MTITMVLMELRSGIKQDKTAAKIWRHLTYIYAAERRFFQEILSENIFGGWTAFVQPPLIGSMVNNAINENKPALLHDCYTKELDNAFFANEDGGDFSWQSNEVVLVIRGNITEQLTERN